MKDQSKTKQVLIQGLASLKRRIAELVQAILVTIRPDGLVIKLEVYSLSFM
jgi:hypothetical protein